MSVEFQDNRVEVKAAMNAAIVAFFHEAGGELAACAARNSRVKTGQTKGSFDYNVNESAGECVVGSPLENALWEEFGTGEYALNGDGRKGGWVYRGEDGTYHRTRGKRPNRALFHAFSDLKDKIIKQCERIMRNEMGG